mgnify:CR=1 FL=1
MLGTRTGRSASSATRRFERSATRSRSGSGAAASSSSIPRMSRSRASRSPDVPAAAGRADRGGVPRAAQERRYATSPSSPSAGSTTRTSTRWSSTTATSPSGAAPRRRCAIAKTRLRHIVEHAQGSDLPLRSRRPIHLPEPGRRARDELPAQGELLGLHFMTLIRADYRDAAASSTAKQIVEQVPNTYFEFPSVTKRRRCAVGRPARAAGL